MVRVLSCMTDNVLGVLVCPCYEQSMRWQCSRAVADLVIVIQIPRSFGDVRFQARVLCVLIWFCQRAESSLNEVVWSYLQ